MKNIGTSRTGGQIVEFSRDEYEMFLVANNAMERGFLKNIDVDMIQFFRGMGLFIEAKFKINDLERLTSELRKIIDSQ
jgi:hypothetical protein